MIGNKRIRKEEHQQYFVLKVRYSNVTYINHLLNHGMCFYSM